ncbi:MAG: Holliday junction branch migration DNA helicase RuvB, partial [Patescibacteria group bacterium]|nr:Holliday junction branch migration DNA helicase RuvB [Patescibacteria group bacterium]
GVVHRLHFYQPHELEHVIFGAAKKLGVEIDKGSIKEIAQRARGTPRIALKLLKRVRDYAQVKGNGTITSSLASEALQMLQVDEVGLDNADIRFLQAIIEMHGGGPVGLETIASSIAEDVGTIEEVIEPYLLQIGFIQKTPRGRVATSNAYKHLHYPVTEKKDKTTAQGKLL